MLGTNTQSTFTSLGEASIRGALLEELSAAEFEKTVPDLTQSIAPIQKPWRWQLRGKLILGDTKINLPEQDFTLDEVKNGYLIRNYPSYPFPRVEIELTASDKNSPLQVSRFSIYPNDYDTTDAGIHCTRLLWSIIKSGECSLQFEGGQVLNIKLKGSFSDEKLLIKWTKLYRKLKFIETIFNTKFLLPTNIAANQQGQIEYAFNAITNGEFSLATQSNYEIRNYQVSVKKLNLPPFSGIGEFNYTVDETLFIFGKGIPVGRVSIHFERAVAGNRLALRNFENGTKNIDLRLIILDHQVQLRFEKYAKKESLKRNKRKLALFKAHLLEEEPEELVNLIDETLSEIPSDVARSIVSGWLHLYKFPDRYCPQEPILEGEQWRVPIWVTYPQGQGGFVENAFVNLKTGVITVPITPEELRQKGKAIAAEILRAS